MKLIRLYPILIASFLLFLFSCKKQSVELDSIIGKWELTSHNVVSNGVLAFQQDYEKGNSYIYNYYPDSTYTVKHFTEVLEKGTYKLESGKLYRRFTGNGYETYGTMKYIISGNSLTLSSSGQDMAGSYTETFIYIRVWPF